MGVNFQVNLFSHICAPKNPTCLSYNSK